MAHPPNYSFGFAAKPVCLSTAFRESDVMGTFAEEGCWWEDTFVV